MAAGPPKPFQLSQRPQGSTVLETDPGEGQAQIRGDVPAMRSPAPERRTELDAPTSKPARVTQLDLGDDAPSEPARVVPGVYSGARRIAGLLVREDRLGFFPLFEGTNRIGRNAGRDIVLDDPMVSDAQCTVTVAKSGRFSVHPAEGARNPVQLAGEEVDLPMEIVTPAVLRIGGANFTVIRLEF